MNLRSSYTPPKLRQVQLPDGSFKMEPLVVSESEISFEQDSRAMESLTSLRKSSSVGAISGIVTRVVDARISKSFEYMQSVESGVSMEEGYSGYSLLASNRAPYGVGLYFRSGQVGFIFVSADRRYCQKEKADNLKTFIQIGKEKYGLFLEGGTWNEDQP